MNGCTDQVFKGPVASYRLRFENGSLIYFRLNQGPILEARPRRQKQGQRQRYPLGRILSTACKDAYTGNIGSSVLARSLTSIESPVYDVAALFGLTDAGFEGIELVTFSDGSSIMVARKSHT